MALRFSHFLSASDLESGLGTDSGPVKIWRQRITKWRPVPSEDSGPGMNCECIYVGKDFWICDCLDTVIGSCDSTYIHRSSLSRTVTSSLIRYCYITSVVLLID